MHFRIVSANKKERKENASRKEEKKIMTRSAFMKDTKYERRNVFENREREWMTSKQRMDDKQTERMDDKQTENG